MNLFCICLSLLVTICSIPAQTFSFMFDGQNRSYIIHLPTGYTGTQKLPLVLNLHGYTSNAQQQQSYSKMNQTANTNNFIVVYPDGINNAWNAGAPVIGQPYNGGGVNDVGFINALLDTLIANYAIDSTRMFSCGMSNGGYMSYRLACELDHRIAAVASVTGVMFDSTAFYCNPARKVPTMQVHGTADPIVNYNNPLASLSVEETVDFWVNRHHCSIPADSNDFPDVNTNDNSTARSYLYGPCDGNSEVYFIKITGGGHTWPSGLIDIPAYGNTNRDFDCSQEIWDFFNKFQLLSTPEISPEPLIQVYPNPTDGILHISSGTKNAYELFHISGLPVKKGYISGQVVLDCSGLPSGIYFLRFRDDIGKTYTQKIVIY